MNLPEMPPVLSVADLPFAYGKPSVTGRIRSQPSDFIVEEIPGFEPEGSGDHVFLTIRKTGLTTNAVAGRLKQFTGVPAKEIGYAGMKDRHAVTTQTFSVNMAGKAEADWALLNGDGIEVLSVDRHRRKLKRGVLKGNRFRLRIIGLQGDLSLLESALQRVALQGVPNFFGEQRFGRDEANLQNAWRLLHDRSYRVGRDERGMLFSSVRSMLFNAVLTERIRQDNWHLLVPGEVINLDGTERHFAEAIDDVLKQRAREMDVHGTGPLPGKASRALVPDEIAGDAEAEALRPLGEWIEPLVKAGLEHARRPLRIAVREMQWQLQGDVLELDFALTSGAYATVVLRELVDVSR